MEVDPFADPLGESGARQLPDTNRAPSLNPGEAPPKSKAWAARGDADGEAFGARQNDVKKSEDIFEEPPKDGDTETAPGASGGRKTESADLFGDADDGDLFDEPLQAVAKKPQAKESGKGRTDQAKDAATDVLAEEVKAAKPGTDTGSRTNGLHSDEDDLFTGAPALLGRTQL